VADDWQRFSWRCSGSAGSDSRLVFLYWTLDLEFADMTQEDNMRIAREAGFVEYELEDYTQSGYDIRYERFAALVRADERGSKKPWVGLTDDDIDLLEELYAPPVHPDFVNDADHCLELIRHVEAKLKEKNT
jgi:hypothetical protein